MNPSELLKSTVKKAFVRSRVLNVASRFASPAIVILRYHSVLDATESQAKSIGPTIIHRLKLFKQQMDVVARLYNPVTLDEVDSSLKTGNITKKSVAITFDDGFKDNYTYAFPILEQYRLKAAFYITTSSIESDHPPWFCRLQHAFRNTTETAWCDSFKGVKYPISEPNEWRIAFLTASKRCSVLIGEEQDRVIGRIEEDLGISPITSNADLMMNWKEIRALHQHGHIIGSHTQSHPNLAFVGENELSSELQGAKQTIENRINAPVHHFSYPSPIGQPHWNDKTIAMAKASGYQTSVTCTRGRNLAGGNALALKRMAVPFTIADFVWNLELCFLGR